MIARILRALSRRVTEIDRRLAVETRARTEDTVWLRRELGLHLVTVELPAPCYTCGATHGREIARVTRAYNHMTGVYQPTPTRVLKCVACGASVDVPVELPARGDASEERPS